MNDLLHLTEELRNAGSNRERAGTLLRVSDAALLPYHAQLAGICALNRFQAGADFIAHRVAALCAVRDAHGLLPNQIAVAVDAYRDALSRFSAGEGAEPDAQ